MGGPAPLILVTGTPGVGKTTFCNAISDKLNIEHIEVGALVREQKLYSEWDDEMNCSVFDEERVVEALREAVGLSDDDDGGSERTEEKGEGRGGILVDFHSCEFLPPSWFHLVVVLRSDTAVLYDRLQKKKFVQKKIEENVECEIFQIVLDEALGNFSGIQVVELVNDTMADLEKNVEWLLEWIQLWGTGTQPTVPARDK